MNQATQNKIYSDLRFYRNRLEKAKENESNGIYLWRKMSEHNAEMYYLEHKVKLLGDKLKELTNVK